MLGAALPLTPRDGWQVCEDAEEQSGFHYVSCCGSPHGRDPIAIPRETPRPFTISAVRASEFVVNIDLTAGNAHPAPIPDEEDVVRMLMTMQWA